MNWLSNALSGDLLSTNVHICVKKKRKKRWSARIDAVKRFAKHLPGIYEALEELKTLNLTPETHQWRFEIHK